MRSPALAIAWEFRQRHRLALLVFASYALTLLSVRRLVLGPGEPLRIDSPSGLAAVVIVPLMAAFFYLLAVFSFGLDGDVAGRASLYPARLFTLPVTTWALAGWPMLYGTTAMASLWLVAAPFVRWSWGLDQPLIWPALLAAVFLAWTQVLSWTGYGLPGLRVLVTLLWLTTLDAVLILAVHLQLSEPLLVMALAPQLPLAYLAACRAVARARRGDVPDWRGAFAPASLARALSPRRGRFASPARAQAWFEWRQRGRVLPVLVAILLPFELGLLLLASDEPAVLVELTLLAVLLTPPFLAGFTAAAAGRSGDAGADLAGATLAATRPLTTAALVTAKLKAAIASTLVAWLLVVVAVPLALALTGSWPVVAQGIGEMASALGRPRAIVVAVLGFALLLASTWKQLVQSLCISLAGRDWVVRASVLARLSFLIVLFPALDWVAEKGTAFVLLWESARLILAALATVKLLAAAWIAARLHRSRLLGGRALLTGAASWLGAVLALYGVLVWLVSTPPFIPRYVPLLIAILAVPLARVGAAPLALAWSRHQGLPGSGSSGTAGDNRMRGAVYALLGLPLVLLLVETASFHVRSRNDGRLVSSGLTREYRLHVPARYDPAKPTPLVISMHGAGGWPAAQEQTSRWSELADEEGFIVVYPSGLSGRGPRIWRADRGLARDVRFISDLIDGLQASYNIDPTRIYADGLSNGGGMAFVLSCTLSDRIAAVGMVASAQLLPFDWCQDERAVPVIAVHGTSDRLTPLHGGESWVVPRPLPDIPGFVAEWSRRNRCGPDPVETAVAADVSRLEYTGCADDASAVLYTVAGGGHTWPGGEPLPEWLTGPTSRSMDATRLMWAFYRERRLTPGQREGPGAAEPGRDRDQPR